MAAVAGKYREILMVTKARFALPIALFFCHQLSCADTILNKCTDGKEITYTDKPCEKLGLDNAGPISRETVTIVPATRIPQMPQKSGDKQAADQPESQVAAEAEVYQCTNYFGAISFSDSPCTGAAFVPQLKAYVPARQQTVSRAQACEKINADPEIKSLSSLSCP
jgi:hypothetical protein